MELPTQEKIARLERMLEELKSMRQYTGDGPDGLCLIYRDLFNKPHASTIDLADDIPELRENSRHGDWRNPDLYWWPCLLISDPDAHDKAWSVRVRAVERTILELKQSDKN